MSKVVIEIFGDTLKKNTFYMSKSPLQEIRGFDSATGGVNERDGIRKLNAKKGFGSKDSTPPEQQLEEEPKPTPVRGSDNSISEPKEPTPATPTAPRITLEEDGTVTLSHTQLRDMLENAGARQTAEYRNQVEQVRSQLSVVQAEITDKDSLLEQERRNFQDQLEAERKQRNNLTKLFTDFGFAPDGSVAPVDNILATRNVAPMVPMSTRNGISSRDALTEYQRILTDAAVMEPRSIITNTGQYIQRNTRLLDQFYQENRAALRQAMDSLAREKGIFQGRSGIYSKDAPTTFANFPVLLREYLSQIVRIEHSARFVLWQFVNREITTGVPPNQTTLIPRVRHLATGTTSSDWRLTPGTPTTANRQNLTGNNISLPILENGMGKDDTVQPLALADIVMQTNILDLERIIQERIGYNYHQFEDLLIFELLISTTALAYNNGGSAVTLAADVAAGGGGQITMNFLGALRATMANAKVPPLPDGSFIFVGTPDHIAQLETDMQEHHFYADPTVSESMVNMFAMKTRNEYAKRISGYKGRVRGFHVYEGTSFSTGAAGTPGVQTETLGGTSVTTRSGFAMGADAIGWATSLPMEIREDPDTNFGRIQSLIWKSHENATGLDIDPSRTLLPFEVARPVGAEEQLRVWEVRAATVKV